MTKSTITRERIELIANFHRAMTLPPSHDEIEELARMALAAMDSSESVELPLDYLQGHKDGLEWAAQLAESNHPETGDWLYDDPIELAKAIRKGPDMPPVQPVADSETDRNPVLAYADSYRDMAKQGVESVPIWIVITDLERNIAPRYRHAQPAPVVPEEIDAIISKAVNGVMSTYSDSAEECRFMVRNHISQACRAAMLQNVTLANEGDIQAGNSLEIPEGYVLVPREPTDEMIAAAMDCDDVLFNSDETFCVQFGNIYEAMTAAAPQEVTSARVHPARE